MLTGGLGDDELFGNGGQNHLLGDFAVSTLNVTGGTGPDSITGGLGADILDGRDSAAGDSLSCGSDVDRYRFDSCDNVAGSGDDRCETLY